MILLQSVSSRGVMFFQFLPASFVSPELAVVSPGPDGVHVVEPGRNRINRAALLPALDSESPDRRRWAEQPGARE